MYSFNVRTKRKQDLIDITDSVRKFVPKNFSGLCSVFVRHATAAILINENWDEYLKEDITDCMNKLVPEGVWKHDKIDGNGAAHIKAAIIGPSEIVPVKDGELLLGTWQGIGLAEFDGPKERKVVVTFV